MKHKTCSKCKNSLPEEDFYKKTKDRTQAYCKRCFNDYCMERWKEKKTKTIQSFGGVCHDCSSSFPSCCFDFHHLDPNKKEFDWIKLRQMGNDKRAKELSKCIMLCSNCHRIRHYVD